MDGTAQVDLGSPVAAAQAVALDGPDQPVAVARHRRHRFPARTESVRARYDRDELAVVAEVAARAGLTTSGVRGGDGVGGG